MAEEAKTLEKTNIAIKAVVILNIV